MFTIYFNILDIFIIMSFSLILTNIKQKFIKFSCQFLQI